MAGPHCRPVSPAAHLEKGNGGYKPLHPEPCPSPPRTRRVLLAVGMLAILASLLLLAPGLHAAALGEPNSFFGGSDNDYAGSIYKPKNGTDPFQGKTLAPSNITVVTGLFRQDDPDLDEDGYDMLKDGFGLLDKGKDRWRKFTK